MSRKVAIVGAGSSGLAAIKSCLENGLDPVCFEISDKVGGLWNYVEEDVPNRGTVFRGVVTNTSRDVTAYSDFPHPRKHPVYLPHQTYASYLQAYAEHFQLIQHVKFNHHVLKIKPSDDHERTGQWLIEVEVPHSSHVHVEVFDFVIVASGHHAHPHIPFVDGQTSFRGVQIHSQQYRSPERFANQNVLVVGFGNSGCDIAVECSSTAKSVRLSSRKNGGWILPRTLKNGAPMDAVLCNRYSLWWQSFLPVSWQSSVFENIINNTWDHDKYGLKPKHRYLNQFPIINDRFPLELLFGKINLCGKINRFTEKGIVFEGSETTVPLDAVVYATGFRPYYPFLEGVLDVETRVNSIFKMVFPVDMSKNTLAFVGLIDTDSTSVVVVAEMQSRWITRVFAGKCSLPSIEEMKNDNKIVSENQDFFFGEGHRLQLFIFAANYVDEIASFISVKPNMFKLLFTDPKLYWACLMGPLHPSQFRLRGPNQWNGARKTILSYENRLSSVRQGEKRYERNGRNVLVPLGCIFVVSLTAVWFISKPQTTPEWMTTLFR